jgi:hypothetical protein
VQSILAAVLTILSVTFTSLAVAITLEGPAVATAIGAISGLALIAWLWAGSPQDTKSDSVIAPYLLSIPLLLVLDTIRYVSGWVGFLAASNTPLFAARLAVNDANWFVVFVCAPATLILLGGYFLSKRHPIGHYMAWWAGLFVIAEGFLQLWADTLGGRPFTLYTVLGSFAALALMLAGIVICQRLLSDKATAAAPIPEPMTMRQINLWSVLFVALVAVYAVTLYQQAGPLPVIIIALSMLGGLVGWRLTTAQRGADPAGCVPLLLLLLALFYLHVGEEFVTGFNRAIAAISGTPWSDSDFTLVIGLVGPVVWFFAAWSLWKRQPFGNFVFWFLIIGMILGEPTHLLLFPIMAMRKFGIGYEYFPGMYTALFPMIPAILALVMIVGEHRSGAEAAAT